MSPSGALAPGKTAIPAAGVRVCALCCTLASVEAPEDACRGAKATGGRRRGPSRRVGEEERAPLNFDGELGDVGVLETPMRDIAVEKQSFHCRSVRILVREAPLASNPQCSMTMSVLRRRSHAQSALAARSRLDAGAHPGDCAPARRAMYHPT